MIYRAKRAALLLLAVCVLLQAGCAGKAEAETNSSRVNGFSQGSNVVNAKEDGVRIQTAVPTFVGFSAAQELNEKIREISDNGLAEVKRAEKELGNSAAKGNLFFQSCYDLFWDNDILSVWVMNENYTGGAHGYRWVKSFNVNIQTGESYDTPGALFKDPEAGTKQITDKILKDIKERPDLYFSEAAKTVEEKHGAYSYYLDGQDLVVYFDLYELMPYAGGMPEFRFSLDDLDLKFRMGNNPDRLNVRHNGMDMEFQNPVVVNDGGVLLPLEETADTLNHTVEKTDAGYKVDGKSVKPTMIDGVAYMPVETFNTLGENGPIPGFVFYDGKTLWIFTQTAQSEEEKKLMSSSMDSVGSEIYLNSAPGGTSSEVSWKKRMCYIKSYDEKTETVALDPIEWITSEDKTRIQELKLDGDFPDGYYIYNPTVETEKIKLSENAKISLIQWNAQNVAESDVQTDAAGLGKRLAEDGALSFPYEYTVSDGKIIALREQYVP
ncbi:DUF3298 domain-containing protein [Caproiciproducens sp. R2]|uniref:DUF3298 domain-containing protein n=1 Tax=Caproiciproducens sp. R2 TaxID=3435187 RepID=UPI00403342D4